MLEDADGVARAAQRLGGIGAWQTQRLLRHGFWDKQGAGGRSGAARQQGGAAAAPLSAQGARRSPDNSAGNAVFMVAVSDL